MELQLLPLISNKKPQEIGAFRFYGMDGKILALQMGLPRIITTSNGVQEQLGYRPILSVRFIVAKVQTTVFFGNDLYSLSLTSNISPDILFANLIKNYANRQETWVQLQAIPNPVIPYPTVQFQYRPNVPPVSTGVMSALAGGYDPLRGYWVEFAGNYFLQFPIFRNFSEVVRDGPNFKGPQHNP